MNITIAAPPALTGETVKDLENLQEWCNAFYMHLKQVLYMLDSSNITELDADCLTGSVSLEKTAFSGNGISISDNSFKLSSADGSQYLIFENDSLKLKGTVTAI